MLHVDTPSTPLSFMSFASTETDTWDESTMRTSVQRDGGVFRSLASIMEDISDCTWASEACDHSMMSRSEDVNCHPYPDPSRYLFTVGGWNDFTSQAIYEAKIEAKKEALKAEIERRVAERMPRINGPVLINSSSFASLPDTKPGIPRSVSDMIRDYLEKEGAGKMTPSYLRPIPHSSSAKPLPLCLKPKQTTRVSDSDKASLARLQHSWEVASFGGWYMKDSDCHSLYIVERTWPQLRNSYHLFKIASHEDIERRIARVHHQLTSLVHSLRHSISDLQQLAIDVDRNCAQHIKNQKVPPSRSYWSFSILSKDANNEKSSDELDDDDKNRNAKDMRFNLGWAAPGTALNESKAARIERLRKDGFSRVGLRNEQRGHKGDEWYAYMCEDALKDVTCL